MKTQINTCKRLSVASHLRSFLWKHTVNTIFNQSGAGLKFESFRRPLKSKQTLFRNFSDLLLLISQRPVFKLGNAHFLLFFPLLHTFYLRALFLSILGRRDLLGGRSEQESAILAGRGNRLASGMAKAKATQRRFIQAKILPIQIQDCRPIVSCVYWTQTQGSLGTMSALDHTINAQL